MIKIATKEIVKELNELGNEYLSDFEKKYDINEIIKSSNEFIYYYEINKKPLAFIHFTFVIDTIDIINIYVTPKYRKHQLASKLFNHITNFFNNYETMSLEVNVNNIPAINLYKKQKFEIVSTRKKYYKDEDAYLMIRRNK